MDHEIKGRFIWRKAKAALVWRARKIAFADICAALDDPHSITWLNEDGSRDVRWVSVGKIGGKAYTIVHKPDGLYTRIITAWPSTEQEHDDYLNQA